MATTDEKKAAAIAAAQVSPPITAETYADTPALAIPLAGLLAAEPDLRDAELPREEWQARVEHFSATYETS